MAELLFVTSNEGKLQEARQILAAHGHQVIGASLNTLELQSDNPRDILLHKAEVAYAHFQRSLIVDDTALYFQGYPSFPGSYTKAMVSTLGLAGLNKLIENNQGATFVSYVCLFDGDAHVFEGYWKGRLVKGVNLKGHWPYNSMFLPDGQDKVLAEIPWSERIGKSHRFHALSKLAEFLKERDDDY